MPLSQWNLPFLVHNAQREYPLASGTTGQDATGSFTIPFEFLLELDLPIHAAMDMTPGNFFIREVGVFPTGFSLTVSYNDVSEVVDVATAMISRQNHTRNKVYNLGGLEPFDDTNGKVVIGRTEAIDDEPAGLWTFEYEATKLDPDVIRPQIRGVQGLVAVNGNERSELIQGDVEFVAGTNFQIVPVLAEGQDPQLVFNAISGEGLNQDCICEGDLANAPCVKRFNGVMPTDEGRFYLVGDECIEWQAIDHGLKAVDKCCSPCCGCEELEAITRDLERFNTQRLTLEKFAEEMLSAVTELEMTVLGSRLGDKGCVTCE